MFPSRLRFEGKGLRGQFPKTLLIGFREITDVPETPAKCFRSYRGRVPCRLFEGLVDAVEAQSRQIGHAGDMPRTFRKA